MILQPRGICLLVKSAKKKDGPKANATRTHQEAFPLKPGGPLSWEAIGPKHNLSSEVRDSACAGYCRPLRRCARCGAQRS